MSFVLYLNTVWKLVDEIDPSPVNDSDYANALRLVALQPLTSSVPVDGSGANKKL